MYIVRINGKEFHIGMNASGTTLDGKEFEADYLEIKNNRFHIIRNNQSFLAETISTNEEEKSFVIRVNGRDYSVSVKDKYDVLLDELGMDNSSSKKVNDIVAPMPGLVLKVMVENGQKIQKGDAIVILEAMKMENVLKAPSDAVVSKIHIASGDKVEKKQVLISLG